MKRAIFLLVISASAFIAAIYFGQRKMIYAGTSSIKPPVPAGVQEVDLGQSYGLFLNAAHTNNDQRPVIIHFHGNSEFATDWIDHFSQLLDQGISSLLVEYPGYAGAPGRPDIDSISSVVLAAYDYTHNRSDVDIDKIFTYGRSLGGGPSAIMARDRAVSGLILESTFSSMSALVREKGFPSIFLTETYDNESIVRAAKVRILIIHGLHDTIIPVSHGERLAQASENGEFITLDCAHNNCPGQLDKIVEFVNAH